MDAYYFPGAFAIVFIAKKEDKHVKIRPRDNSRGLIFTCLFMSALIAAYCGGFEDQEDRVDKNAQDGRKHDGGDSVGE